MKHRNGKIKLKEFQELFYNKHLPVQEVADYFGVTSSAIGSFRHRYNLAPRGWSKHPMLGKKHSQESKNKISQKLKGKLVGAKNGRWCGNKRTNYQGYVLVRKPDHPFADCNGWVREHRIIVEKNINRILDRGENVHHRNGDKSDNCIKNLVVCSNSEHHSKFHIDSSIKNLSKSPSHIKNTTAK